MKITLEAKPYEILVEVPGYGIFKVHRIGAGTEADLAAKSLEIKNLNDRLADEYGDISAREVELIKSDDKAGLEALRATEEYKAAKALQKKISADLDQLNARIVRTELSLWKSDDQDVLERFLRELSLEQIRSLYRQAIEQADGKAE